MTNVPDLIALEKDVIKTLDWDLVIAGPLFFLERYQRIFGVDQEKLNYEATRVGSLARDLIRLIILNPAFIGY